MKWILLSLLLSGCYYEDKSATEQLFVLVNERCPKICEEKGQKWNGLLHSYPETLKCMCDEKSK
jgi:hypothetical protein